VLAGNDNTERVITMVHNSYATKSDLRDAENMIRNGAARETVINMVLDAFPRQDLSQWVLDMRSNY